MMKPSFLKPKITTKNAILTPSTVFNSQDLSNFVENNLNEY